MYVLLAGLNHRTAPVDIREKFAISGAALDSAYDYFKGCSEVEGTLILATCNRTEIYATARDIEPGMEILKKFMADYAGMDEESIAQYLYQPNCYDAIMHLFKVTSGLDSMIIGECQIMGQVREAYQKGIEAGATDGVLNALFQKAIYVGKRVRTETIIEKHPLSVSYAAVELARQRLGGLGGKTVLVVGAGEMSELTTHHLMMNGVESVIVSNRSFDRAQEMAREFNGRAVYFDQLPAELANADIVISCTAASHYVIRDDNCRQALESRLGRDIIMIDIAVPRDIDPVLSAIPNVFIYDIDDLQEVVTIDNAKRQKAMLESERIIAEEIVKFNEWLGSLYVVPVVAALKSLGESIKEAELNRAMNRLGKLTDREEKIIGSMATSIVNQLLHYPVVNLKEMAVSNQGHLYAEVVKKLFALQVDMKELEHEERFEIRNPG
ncbi:MAG: glutamyl-tRNA reductase [Deltaproteobacteria bacterium]